MKLCKATMQAKFDPKHVHICGRLPHADDHICQDTKCRRYFNLKGAL